MARRPKKKLPTHPVELAIEKLSHDGRGIAYLDGKIQFVDGALTGETVKAIYTDTRSRFDELRVQKIIVASEDRVAPPCAHAQVCGGCSLQHISPAAQIEFKQSALQEQFKHFGNISDCTLLEPVTGPVSGYRRKARLGVGSKNKRKEIVLGFREKNSGVISGINECMVLDERIATKIIALRELISTLNICRSIAQVEVAAGDKEIALIFRHITLLRDDDAQKLIEFGAKHNFHIYLQPEGPASVHRIYPKSGEERLSYRLEEFSLDMTFHPNDFTQVNADINKKMISRAVEWLDLSSEDRVLDLFCGLGNFTLPLARKAGKVIGVEGDEAMVVRGRENAEFNKLDNIEFYGANLQADFTKSKWAKDGFDKILIDPPRSGALDVVQYLPAFGAKKIVYVSCNPATLARDAGVLVEHGYKMVKAGVMDMFPHTAHVESIALFEK